ncbi:MAG: TonB family protein [Myxococcales bacterium]|nr:TonB family protein [Myxococcales bacterium]
MLAASGTLAIHLILAVCADAIVVTHPILPDPPARRIELVEIEPPKRIDPPPPPPAIKSEPSKQETAKPAVQQARVVRPSPTHAEPPPPQAAPPPPVSDTVPSGGAPVVAMDDIAPSATGVAVAKGPRTTGHVGRGGTGAGAGSGIGSGSGLQPVSVATIKTRALPKGDYGYFSAGKDYPAEAKALGIEGPIRVKLVVDDQGKVKSAILLNRLGHGLDELALDRAKTIVFEPARDTDDHVVTSVVIWTFNMTLPK